MRKTVCTILSALAVLLFLPFYSMHAMAAEEAMKFSFDLTVDGQDTKEVETGDIITVVLKLRRTDASDGYTMYAMQDEIRYDSTFFELVEGSDVLGSGIVSTDIAKVDDYREFYMNYLSMNGGTDWESDTLIGSFQLKVIGKSGVTKITSQDYLVSLQDGSDSYPCVSRDVTIILSTDCTVVFRTNGGSALPEMTVQFGEKIPRPKDPVREGFRLEGWYTDIHLTDKWDFENNTVQGNMSLYAKWVADTSVDGEQNEDAKPKCCVCWILLLIILIILFILFRKRKRKRKDEGMAD